MIIRSKPCLTKEEAVENPFEVTERMTLPYNNNCNRKSPLSMNIDELANKLGGRGRALSVWDCYRVGIDALFFHDQFFPPEMLDNSIHKSAINNSNDKSKTQGGTVTRNEMEKYLPARRRGRLGSKSLENLWALCSPLVGIESIAKVVHIQTTRDGTTKLLLNLKSSPKHYIETVIIPWDERGHSTLCVSSQVGCRQGCTFCATGRMGKLLDLTTDEILIQLYYAKKVCRVRNLPPIENIVFMGMGEPTDNIQSVTSAVNLMVENNCFNIPPSKITVSTIAPNPDVFEKLPNVPLAWSVHAVRDSLRKQLVPTTKYSMNELRQGIVNTMKTRPKKLRTVMLEVTLIQNVNDSEQEALELTSFSLELVKLVGDMKLIINLIPYNDIGNNKFKKPSINRIMSFQRVIVSELQKKGGNTQIKTYVRRTRGDDESAACGQLATNSRNKESF